MGEQSQMSTIFTADQTVWTEIAHQSCRIDGVLGEGGQGEVYSVSVDGRPAAMKWYHRQFATPQQMMNLGTLARKGPPTNRFLWPIELVSAPGRRGLAI